MIETDICLTGGGYSAWISSRKGGTCFRLRHASTGAELLRTPRDDAERAENVFLFGNPILYPPNRIKGGGFFFDGREYRFPINEPAHGCHIHGALYDLPFTAERRTASTVLLTASFEAGEYPGVPNAFTVQRRYELGSHGLRETAVFRNHSDFAFPLMLAYHTTIPLPFCAEGDPGRTVLSLPVKREWLRDAHFLPTGETKSGDRRQTELNAGTFVPYADAVSAFYEAMPEPIRLTDESLGRSIVYSADARFGYRMLFRAENAGYTVTEPQTCAIDCFRMPGGAEANGLIVIPPHGEDALHTCLEIRESGRGKTG